MITAIGAGIVICPIVYREVFLLSWKEALIIITALVRCREGNERAARDIMAALVDCAHNKVDIEISDKDLFLIYEDEFYTEQNITALFGTAEVMLEGLLKLSKTWLALGKWEERMISRAARSVRHKLMTGIGPKGLIAFALIVLLFILLMAGRMSQ